MKAAALPRPLSDAPETLGQRMKRDYEDPYRFQLPLRMPIVLRVDGRAFHTFCAEMERPFDTRLIHALNQVAIAIVSDVAGAQLAYLQSDEINVLVHNSTPAPSGRRGRHLRMFSSRFTRREIPSATRPKPG